MYYSRLINRYLEEWALRLESKPLLLRGARQVGKPTAFFLGRWIMSMLRPTAQLGMWLFAHFMPYRR